MKRFDNVVYVVEKLLVVQAAWRPVTNSNIRVFGSELSESSNAPNTMGARTSVVVPELEFEAQATSFLRLSLGFVS